ncbi:MAG: hypothetical protein N6V49_10995, partial [Serratia symbiotica]|nr:hypothetical protein [Serratia symbiotica]
LRALNPKDRQAAYAVPNPILVILTFFQDTRRENKNYKLIPSILQGMKSIGMPKRGTAMGRIMYNGE